MIWQIDIKNLSAEFSIKRGVEPIRARLLTIAVMLFCIINILTAAQPDEKKEIKKTTKYTTWYGGKFHGRKTSSGEKYNMYGMTAAHRTLPFGTKVRVTNPLNNKSVVVKINDRGPFQKKYEIDLTYKAFEEIRNKNKGEVAVIIEVLGKDSKEYEEVNLTEPEKEKITEQPVITEISVVKSDEVNYSEINDINEVKILSDTNIPATKENELVNLDFNSEIKEKNIIEIPQKKDIETIVIKDYLGLKSLSADVIQILYPVFEINKLLKK